MEVSAELLHDIEIYVRDFLKAKSVARMKADIKKSMIEKGNDEPNVRRFLDWKEMKDKIEEQDILIQTMKELKSDIDTAEIINNLKYDLKKAQQYQFMAERFRENNSKLLKENKRLRSKNIKDNVKVEKGNEYESLNKKYLDLLNYNRELESKVDTLKNRCKKQDLLLAPKPETIKETAENNYGISEEQIYGSYYDED
jgi:predicted MPP superfamily phosphohydrolase